MQGDFTHITQNINRALTYRSGRASQVPLPGCNLQSSRSINKDGRILKYGQARLQPDAASHAGRAQHRLGQRARFVFLQRAKTDYLTLAGGSSSGESYILGKALKTVVERHYPRIKISLLETGGTVENLQMLEDGRAQLATAQADILPGPRARALAVLYDDTFQLLVPKSSQVQSLVDLRGQRIALAQSGGQFQSFLRVVEHFGLHQADFQFVGTNDEAAEDAFLKGQADAIFRVRAIGDPSIEHLVQSNRVRFLPVEHAAAMKIKHPAFEAALIPVGAYLGNPPGARAGLSDGSGTAHVAGSR